MSPRQRLVTLAAAVLLVAGGSTAYGLMELNETRQARQRQPSVPTTTAPTLSGPRLVFRHTGVDQEYGVVAEVSLDDPSGPRAFTGVSCDRVDAVARGASCLRTNRGVVTTFTQVELDADWQEVRATPLPGIPSRTRFAEDGTLVASTSFVTGHSYLSTGFSTAAEIHAPGGRSYGNLEDFTLMLRGREAAPADRNIWGVTFADDGDTFYATVATGELTYLARGSLARRTLTTIAEHVECPSLSPDGTRIAYKELVEHESGPWWTPAVLDLATMRRTALRGEQRNVDDQLEWLDGDTLLYGLARDDDPAVTDVWALDTRPDAEPRLYVEQAWSPAVVR